MLKSRLVLTGTALALGLLPGSVVAAPVQAGMMELHIEATAEIEPDTARVPMHMEVMAASQEEADTELEQLRRNVVDRLGAMGIEPAKISWNLTPSGNIARRIDIAAAAEEAEAVAGAMAAAYDASAERPKKRRIEPAPARIPSYFATGTLTVTVEDLAKLPQVAEIGSINGAAYDQVRRITFFVRGAQSAQQAAIAKAIAKARADADAHAAVLGYRVLRMQRVSNARPVFNVPDMITLMSRSEGPNRDPKLAGVVTASVAIDFVITPN